MRGSTNHPTTRLTWRHRLRSPTPTRSVPRSSPTWTILLSCRPPRSIRSRPKRNPAPSSAPTRPSLPVPTSRSPIGPSVPVNVRRPLSRPSSFRPKPRSTGLVSCPWSSYGRSNNPFQFGSRRLRGRPATLLWSNPKQAWWGLFLFFYKCSESLHKKSAVSRFFTSSYVTLVFSTSQHITQLHHLASCPILR